MPWVHDLQSVSVVFPEYTHFFIIEDRKQAMSLSFFKQDLQILLDITFLYYISYYVQLITESHVGEVDNIKIMTLV